MHVLTRYDVLPPMRPSDIEVSLQEQSQDFCVWSFLCEGVHFNREVSSPPWFKVKLKESDNP